MPKLKEYIQTLSQRIETAKKNRRKALYAFLGFLVVVKIISLLFLDGKPIEPNPKGLSEVEMGIIIVLGGIILALGQSWTQKNPFWEDESDELFPILKKLEESKLTVGSLLYKDKQYYQFPEEAHRCFKIQRMSDDFTLVLLENIKTNEQEEVHLIRLFKDFHLRS